ncbi:ArsR/SmtB family transcription factor [Limnoglobus roseus]|uniref:ArsR family transcriptional regulator n=1 Tax=Limnoglobus roseus TaxID=2598579 RepID=A0A5C1AII5_9BACT|nr:metalloregulator ArsR/SmtB family transcription factor [Limnoglobus roseus]QEL19239.1 ArsR family transcriptional regulator [Limnoglobus roseus]
MTDYQTSRTVAAILAALGEPTRLSIVHEMAAAGPSTVGNLAKRMSSTTTRVSPHLRVLKDAGILEDRREGKTRVYRFAPGVFAPSQWAGELGTLHFGGWRISIGRTAWR